MNISFHFSGVNAQESNCCIVVGHFVLQETAKMFSRVTVPLKISLAVYEWSCFSTFTAVTTFSFSHSHRCIWYLIGVLVLITVMANEVEYIFSLCETSCVYLLAKYLFTSFSYFLIGLFGFYCWVFKVLYIF